MRYCWFPCTIENTGFSSERRFEVELPKGGGKVVGIAYIDYLKNDKGEPLREGTPQVGQEIKGFVQCRLLRQQGDVAQIEFPGTDVIHVPQEALVNSC